MWLRSALELVCLVWIGSDEAGRSLEELLAKASITSYLNHDPSISTIIKLRVIGRQQQLVRVDFEEKPSAHVLRQADTLY